MGIFKRIKDITLAEVNGFLDKTEDPISMLNHYLREMEEEITKGEQALANQIFLEKRQIACLANTEELIEKRARQAQLAVDQGEDQIAKMALQEKLIQEKNLGLQKQQFESIKSQTTTLYEKLNQLKQKFDELKHKRLLLISRANTAQSIKRIHNMAVSLNTDHISKGFARTEERVLMMEAEVEARNYKTNLNSYPIDPMLQEEVQKELEKLKGTNKETA